MSHAKIRPRSPYGGETEAVRESSSSYHVSSSCGKKKHNFRCITSPCAFRFKYAEIVRLRNLPPLCVLIGQLNKCCASPCSMVGRVQRKCFYRYCISSLRAPFCLESFWIIELVFLCYSFLAAASTVRPSFLSWHGIQSFLSVIGRQLYAFIYSHLITDEDSLKCITRGGQEEEDEE